MSVSSRGDEILTRPKEKNRMQLKEFAAQGKLKIFLNATVKLIGKDTVTIEQDGQSCSLKNDAVIVCAGGTLPTPMLKEIGVMVDTYFGTAVSKQY